MLAVTSSLTNRRKEPGCKLTSFQLAVGSVERQPIATEKGAKTDVFALFEQNWPRRPTAVLITPTSQHSGCNEQVQ